jgi:hypothetical protein
MSSQTVTLTIQVPKTEIAWLHEALRLSRNRYINPENFIKGTSLAGAKALAASTVCCKDWKHLQALARRLGVESAI